MPHDELEIHPYLNSIDYNQFDEYYFKGLIIGSFPVYAVTDSQLPNNQILQRFIMDKAYMRFYYGSKINSFWKLISKAFGMDNPTLEPLNLRIELSKNLLTNNHLLITDVLSSTNRNGVGSEDNDLWIDTDNEFVIENRSINMGIQNILDNNKAIKYLYFTATGISGKTPFGWFKEIFQEIIEYQIVQTVQNRIVSAEVKINDRIYNAFFLPSPAGNGTRGIHFNKQRTEMFVNYLQSTAPQFYNEIDGIPIALRNKLQNTTLTKHREDFLLVCWRQAFILKNSHFNGNI